MIKIAFPDKNYEINIKEGSLNRICELISSVYNKKKIYIITDLNVSRIYLPKVVDNLKKIYDVDSVIFEAGEESKNIKTYEYLVTELLKKEIHRGDLIIGLGGGVVGDISGFVAGTLFRGLSFINIPTSLLSQLDSSIGGKTGIDYLNQKNVLGVFKQPELVIIDPETLATLPDDEYKNGIGELIKHAFIGSEDLCYELLNSSEIIGKSIIEKSIMIKKKYVEEDEYDTGNRMILNFGHTFGHIIELQNNIKHGFAVGIGMVMAVKLGIDLKITNKRVLPMLQSILKKYGLPCGDFDYHYYLNMIFNDKKNISGKLNLILLEDIGRPIIYKIEKNKIEDMVKK